jgi:hypothetical protein
MRSSNKDNDSSISNILFSKLRVIKYVKIDPEIVLMGFLKNI